jgi:hypothetical protein
MSSSSSSSSSSSKNELSDNINISPPHYEGQIKNINQNPSHSPPNPIIQDDIIDLSAHRCNLLVPQIFQFGLLNGDVCKYCGLSLL